MCAASHPFRIIFQIDECAASAESTQKALLFTRIRGGMRCGDFVRYLLAISASEFDPYVGGLHTCAIFREEVPEGDSTSDLKFRSAISVRLFDALF